jgi:hypothetical protein
MNIDSGEIRKWADLPEDKAERERWTELAKAELAEMEKTAQAERPQRLAEMRGGEWGDLNRAQRRANGKRGKR